MRFFLTKTHCDFVFYSFVSASISVGKNRRFVVSAEPLLTLDVTMSGRSEPKTPHAAFSVGEDGTLSLPAAAGQLKASLSLRGVNVVIGAPGIAWHVCPLMELAPLECKFHSSSQLKWGTPVTCAFCHAESNVVQTISGRVHWSRKVKDAWHTGVFLDECLEDRFYDAMGEDIRSFLRYEVQWPAVIEFEGSNVRHDVVVQDYCVDGLSLCGSMPHPVGGKFRILGRDESRPDPIATGTVLWQRPHGADQTMIGTQAAGRELSWFFAICPEQTCAATEDKAT